MNKECLKIMDLIDDSEIRELSPKEVGVMAQHVDDCSRCQAYREQADRLGELIHDFKKSELKFRAGLSPDLEDSIMEKIMPRKRIPLLRLAIASVFVFIVALNFVIQSGSNDAVNPVSEGHMLSAHIISGTGNYFVNTSGKWMTPDPQDSLALPLDCKTSAFTTMKIAVGDFCETWLRPNTVISVNKDRISISSGKVLFDFDKLDAPFYINHELGTVTILGTKLIVEAGDDSLRISLIEGKIEINNKFGSITLNAGQETLLTQESINMEAYRLDPSVADEIRNWNSSDFLLNTNSSEQAEHTGVQGKVPDIEEEFSKLKGSNAP